MINNPIIISLSVLAINSDEYIDIYKKYDDFFSNFNVFIDFLRYIGWLLLKGFIKLNSLMYIVVDKIFDFVNFLDSDEVIQFFNSVKPLIWTVFLFALIYLAYCYLIAHEKPKGVVSNLLIFAITVMVLPYLMSQATQIVTYAKEALAISSDDSGYSLLIPYITDLVYLDSIDFDSEKIDKGQVNGFTSNNTENIQYLDINEVVDPGDYKLENEDLFKKQLSTTIEKGVDSLEVTEIKKDKFLLKDATPYYYRYHVNFFIAGLYLLALLIVLVFSSFKLGQLEYELVSEKIITPFIAAGDLTGGQKIRKALIGILNAYITLVCILFLQKLFVLATEYINQTTWAENAAGNGVIKTILILSGALFVVDGPNFFEQIFGVDAGLKSVGQALQSAYYGSQMVEGVKRSVSGAVNKVGSAAKGATGKAAGAFGTLAGMKDTGALNSNNEKVSQDMASWNVGDYLKSQPPTSIDPNRELGDGSGNLDANSSELPGGGQPTLPGGSQDSANKMSSGSEPKMDSGIPDGNGRQNLNNMAGNENTGTANAGINNEINDALNNMSSENMGSEVEDNETLSGWVQKNAKNSAAGQYLKGNYDKGKDLGHAIGNSINKRRQKKADGGQNISGQNRDNLKK